MSDPNDNQPSPPPQAPQAGAEDVGDVGEVVVSLQRVTTAVRKRWREGLVAFAVVFLGVWLYTFFWPGKFAAYSAVLVQKVRYSTQLAADPTAMPSVVTGGVSEEDVTSEIAILTSREVLTKTVKNTGLDQIEDRWYVKLLFWPLRTWDDLYAWWHDVPPRTKLSRSIQGLSDAIAVEPMKDSNVLVVSYSIGHPTMAEIVLTELMKNYLEHHVEVRERSETQTFFRMQSDVLRETLASEEGELRALKQELGLADLLAERNIQTTILAELRAEEVRLSRRRAELDARMGAFRSAIDEAPERAATHGAADPNTYALQSIRQDALELELQQIRLEARYPADSPLVIENRDLLDATRRALEDEVNAPMASGAGGLISDYERRLVQDRAERRGLERRLAIVDEQMQQTEALLLDLEDRVLDAREIERRIAATEDKYMMYLRRGEEARIDAALNQQGLTNVTIVQAPSASPKPVNPRKLRSLIASVAGGLLAALLTITVLEFEALGLGGFLSSIAPRRS